MGLFRVGPSPYFTGAFPAGNLAQAPGFGAALRPDFSAQIRLSRAEGPARRLKQGPCTAKAQNEPQSDRDGIVTPGSQSLASSSRPWAIGEELEGRDVFGFNCGCSTAGLGAGDTERASEGEAQAAWPNRTRFPRTAQVAGSYARREGCPWSAGRNSSAPFCSDFPKPFSWNRRPDLGNFSLSTRNGGGGLHPAGKGGS